MHKDSTRDRIFLSPPHMGGEELRFVQEAFDSNYIAPLGPMVDAFEQEFVEKVGISHALAVASGTAAMHRARKMVVKIHCLGIKTRYLGKDDLRVIAYEYTCH